MGEGPWLPFLSEKHAAAEGYYLGGWCRMTGPSEPLPTLPTEPLPLAGLGGGWMPTAGSGLIWEPESAPTLPTEPWGRGGLLGMGG